MICEHTVHQDKAWPAHEKKREDLSLEDEATKMLRQSMLNLFKSNTGDITVHCGEKTWKVHGMIIAPRCRFFQACIEKSFEESVTKIIILDDDDAQAIEIYLEWLYILDSDILAKYVEEDGWHETVELLVSLVKVADKYDQPLLLEAIMDMFLRSDELHLPGTALIQAWHDIDELAPTAWIERIKTIVMDAFVEVRFIDEFDPEQDYDYISEGWRPSDACLLAMAEGSKRFKAKLDAEKALEEQAEAETSSDEAEAE